MALSPTRNVYQNAPLVGSLVSPIFRKIISKIADRENILVLVKGLISNLKAFPKV